MVFRFFRRFFIRLTIGAIVAATCLVLIRLWPHEPLRNAAPHSRIVLADDGTLLRMTTAQDGQFRLWIPLEDVSPSMVEAIFLKEDNYYYWHPGVNPVALVRAAGATFSGNQRQGGSTLTMQLARRLYGIHTRTVGGKLRQIVQALWLQARYSKREILEAYLNLAPMGGNIEGVQAASYIYFGKSASLLSLNEALALAVIPQQPTARARFGASLQEARLRLLTDWKRKYPNDTRTSSLLELPLQAHTREQLPFRAPHLSDYLLQTSSDEVLQSTLSWPLQQQIEQLTRRFVNRHRAQGVHNAVVMLVDSRDASIKALIGSADYHAEVIQGQVNGAHAQRSPGSTLKPFLYGLALDQGIIHPMSVLKDAPSAFGYYQPENFDYRFTGVLTAQEALVRSRNIPAVWLAGQTRNPSLYDLLQRAGVRNLREESFYGLSLTLGGGEVSAAELARLYLMLASSGQLRPLRYLQSDVPSTLPSNTDVAAAGKTNLLSPEAAFLVRDMLRHNPRPDGLPPSTRTWPVAWKTGTSWGFHDAWSAGLVGPYVLVVWVGNFDNTPNPIFVGQKTAAPLFFQIADALPLLLPNTPITPEKPPARLTRVDVCSASGDLPNRWCPQTTPTWYIPGVSPIRVSTLHRPVLIDTRTGQAACPPFDPQTTREEVFEFWSSDVMRIFQASGLPRSTPPDSNGACIVTQHLQTQEVPRIRTPLKQVTYSLRLLQPQESIALNASAAADARTLHWFADRSYLGSSTPQQSIAWRPGKSGHYRIRVTDDRGRSDERTVRVEFVS